MQQSLFDNIEKPNNNLGLNHSVKSIRKQFAESGVFYTDLKLAEMMKDIILSYGETYDIYDPTCGSGNLLSVFSNDVVKFGQEINPEQAQIARQRLNNSNIATGDTLISPAFIDRKFDRIVANYPFSIKWTPFIDQRWSSAPCLPPPSKADYAFIMHIIYMLSDIGVAVVLGFPGILYRGQKEAKIREWLIESNVIESVTLMESGYFEDTKISTALIVFRKGRNDRTIRFCDHESGIENTVSIDEVRCNDYILSPSIYLKYEEKEEDIDPIALEKQARNDVLRRLSKQLLFTSQAIDLHVSLGLPPLPPMSEFITAIDAVLCKYR